MARLRRDGAAEVYAAADVFRERAFESADSLFTPGVPVWTVEALDALHERFVMNPDASSSSFEEKLKLQLSDASDTAVQLMAEILYIHLLISSTVTGAKKREIITNVLSWTEGAVEIPEALAAALDAGLCNPGSFFNTGRDRHLRFVIVWLRDWRQLEPARVQEILGDPWEFKSYLESLEVGSAWLQRNAILHLLYPDTFDRIVSRTDKQAIKDTFAELIGGEQAATGMDVDRAILAVRQKLAGEYGDDFDFYATAAVRSRWKPSSIRDDGEVSMIPLLDRVLRVYPDWSGFTDPRFARDERDYKDSASALAQELLGAGEMDQLIAARHFGELVSRVEKVAQATNLLWLRVPKDGDLGILYRQSFDAAAFAEAFRDLLHGPGSSPERIDRFAAYADASSLPCGWAFVTYFLMLIHPASDFFAKPRATKWFLRETGHTDKIGARANGTEYARIIDAVRQLAEAVQAYEPRDLIDIQGYVWVAHRAPGDEAEVAEEKARDLAAPFDGMFANWDDAWQAFDFMRETVAKLGVESPDDPRLSVTLPYGMTTIHVNFGAWLITGFGKEWGRDRKATLISPQDEPVFDEFHSTGGTFAAKPGGVSVRPHTGSQAEFKELDADALTPFYRGLELAQEAMGHYSASPYRKSHQPAVAAAILDEQERTKLLMEGVTVPEPEETIYSRLASEGYHFPDWLVTDYVLSLATKPLVILSGISGTGKTKMAQLVAGTVAPNVVREVAIEQPAETVSDGAVVTVKRSAFQYRRLTIPFALVEGMAVPEPGQPVDFTVRAGGQTWESRLYVHPSGRNVQVHMKPDLHEWFMQNVNAGDRLVLRLSPVNRVPEFELDLQVLASERRIEKVPSERIAFLSVRPDWTDNRSLLGYYNPLLQAYQPTELLRLLLRATANPDEPHFVVLDEMNLAKVEYYFSDFLSAMESGTEMVLHDSADELLIEEVEGVSVPQRLKVPQNVFFTGTVNVDETTYMFSPKVLDRANTIEFNEVDLALYGGDGELEPDGFRFLDGVSVEEVLTEFRLPGPADWMALDGALKARLRSLHDLMALHNLHFGYRVANEVARYLVLTQQFVGPEAIDAAMDLQVLQKVLPKLSGSRAKLERPLWELLQWCYDPEASGEQLSASALESLEPHEAAYPRSAAKLKRMLETVRTTGFVSFVE